MALVLREATAADRAAVRDVHCAAFGRPDEARLVDALTDAGVVLVSLIAELDGTAAGHIAFSTLAVTGEHGTALPAAALAPLAVVPERQGCGIGSALVNRGLDSVRGIGIALVIVLGDPRYYARFGFSPGPVAALRGPFGGPAWMGLELIPGALRGLSADVTYADAFGIPRRER